MLNENIIEINDDGVICTFSKYLPEPIKTIEDIEPVEVFVSEFDNPPIINKA